MSTATDRLRLADATMTKEEWFADNGKIGVGDSGIGEMDRPADAEGMALVRNALPEIIEVLRATERYVDIPEHARNPYGMDLALEAFESVVAKCP